MRLIGTWKLIQASAHDNTGKALPVPYGPIGEGLITLTAHGRMLAVLCDGRNTIPPGEEREYVSYCGNYTFDGMTLVTHVDSASSPRVQIGSEQTRHVHFEGNILVLTQSTVMNGVAQHRAAYWKKISELSA
ncbi:MAG TPA: lipocalin-like domain-containing protein [Rhizomicrobium sp.]|nr:lipocalin-like domain-containing protein [Rhizomicrobium sp.]